MEEEIMEFLTCRAIQFDEADGSFIVECPNCSSSCESSAQHHKDIYIDKQSGYYVCPWCCDAGTWEELCRVLDMKQDSLSVQELHSFLHSMLPLSDEFLTSLKTSPCKHLSEAVLRQYGCRSSDDGSRLVVPVYWPVSATSPNCESSTFLEPVGYFSISLLQETPQIVSRFIKNRLCAWSSLMVVSLSSTTLSSPAPTEMIVVSSMLDALHLAQLDMPCVVLGGAPGDWEDVGTLPLAHPHRSTDCINVWGLPPSVKTVLVWLRQGGVVPYLFYKFVSDAHIACDIVSSWNETPLHQLQKHEIQARLLSRERLRPNASVLAVADLRDQIYHRLKHPCEVRGVPWRRFPDLQRLLLGHRPGEVTVLSGSTGAGKTTFLAEYSLDLTQQGVTTLWASLEVSKERLCEVLLQQYSGAPLPSDRTSFDALWHAFRQLPLYFLDVHGQQPLDLIMEAIRESVLVRGVRHVVVDNLQFMVGCQSNSGERWQHQDMAMAAFRSFATQYNCHVTLIVHPRKLQAGETLTLQTIGGGARVTQEADNVLLLQVQGANPVSSRKAIEVVKNRYGGHLGIVPIKFQQESLTFSGFFRRAKDQPKKKD
ncbi:P-loop containing nucleoside triphosphate hydrolase [Trinorchestia longiramus]|nr:P-loop containing nucleoside triphosphate hydrolase [Trinorchestia longiramus]